MSLAPGPEHIRLVWRGDKWYNPNEASIPTKSKYNTFALWEKGGTRANTSVDILHHYNMFTPKSLPEIINPESAKHRKLMYAMQMNDQYTVNLLLREFEMDINEFESKVNTFTELVDDPKNFITHNNEERNRC